MTKFKKGDMVQVITGASRGKTGKVLHVFDETGRITVEGANLKMKHSRPRREGQKGQKVEFPAAMSISNVMLLCPKCQKPTRIAMSIKEGEQKRRMCKKCKQMID